MRNILFRMSKNKKHLGRRIAFTILVKIPILLVALSLVWVLFFKWVPVAVTPLMVIRSFEYRQDENFHTTKKWQSLENISIHLQHAVIASEDNLFYEHKGFDWKQIDLAIEAHQKGKRLRGASTISQQTAKNVFLFPGRSWIRKGLEAYFTVAIELIWGKNRIMEVYLNVAEMGKGVYGAEAAAQKFFKEPAAKLTRHQSALIASCLPNPLKRNVGAPSKYMNTRSAQIESLMQKIF